MTVILQQWAHLNDEAQTKDDCDKILLGTIRNHIIISLLAPRNPSHRTLKSCLPVDSSLLLETSPSSSSIPATTGTTPYSRTPLFPHSIPRFTNPPILITRRRTRLQHWRVTSYNKPNLSFFMDALMVSSRKGRRDYGKRPRLVSKVKCIFVHYSYIEIE